jgi:hypothetical protein
MSSGFNQTHFADVIIHHISALDPSFYPPDDQHVVYLAMITGVICVNRTLQDKGDGIFRQLRSQTAKECESLCTQFPGMASSLRARLPGAAGKMFLCKIYVNDNDELYEGVFGMP